MSETNNKKCWECDREDLPIHNHHPIPRVRGGKRTIPLCELCHSKAHHMNKRMSISQLTKEGLAAAKARGMKLGNPNIVEISKKGRRQQVIKANDYADSLLPIIQELDKEGCQRPTHIARELNKRKIPTVRYSKGGWTTAGVVNLLERLGLYSRKKQT